MVLDHADPAGQHAVIQDTVDSLELPRMLPDTILDGGLVEKISDWETAASPVQDTTLDGQLMEGTTWSIRLWGCLWTVDSWRVSQRPGGGITEEISDWEPVAHPVPDVFSDVFSVLFRMFFSVKCLWIRSARRAYGSGLWIWMWNINMRH